MKHILGKQPGEIDFGRYLAYVESIRERLQPDIYAFASDSRYFDLTSHTSLHDAWLESLSVQEVASGVRHEMRRVEISLCLLGPFHDRRIHLHYTGVSRYS